MAQDKTMNDLLSAQISGQNDRINRIEEDVSDIKKDLLPAIARIEERMVALDNKVSNGVEEARYTKKHLIDNNSQQIAVQNNRIEILERAAEAKRKRRSKIVSWVGGIATALLVSAIAAYLGLGG